MSEEDDKEEPPLRMIRVGDAYFECKKCGANLFKLVLGAGFLKTYQCIGCGMKYAAYRRQ